MRALFIGAIVYILTLSRYNLGVILIPRSYYDTLSIMLLLAFIIFCLLSLRLSPHERKIEMAFSRIGGRWIPWLLDSLVFVLAVVFIYESIRKIFFFPINCSTADMLPMVRGAGERLLSLESPFRQTCCSFQGGFPYLPMMMTYYLPAIALKIDLRIVSIFFWLCLSLSGYFYYQKRGYGLTGVLIFIFIMTSGLIPLLLITIHTFPYLFVLSIVLLAFSEDNDKALFFSLALALASRKFFWLYLPFFIIYFFKARKITSSNLTFFGLGSLLGFFPYILFPADIIKSNVDHVSIVSRHLGPPLFLQHSLGWAYHFLNNRMLATVILIVLYSLIILSAVKFLNKRNLWVFMFLSALVFLYLQPFTRSQEYYFLPLVIILMFAPLEVLETKHRPGNRRVIGILTVFSLVFIFLYFPYLSGTSLHVHPKKGGNTVESTGEIQSSGYLDLSLGGNLRSIRHLTFSLRRLNVPNNDPVRVRIVINEQPFLDDVFRARRIDIPVDETSRKKFFYRGGNSVEISLEKPEAFRLRIRRGQLEK